MSRHVLCTIPTATSPIDGIEFEPHPDGGLVSVEPVDDAKADYLLSIPGYVACDAPNTPARAPDPAPDPADGTKASAPPSAPPAGPKPKKKGR